MNRDHQVRLIAKVLNSDLDRIKSLVELLESKRFGLTAINKINDLRSMLTDILKDSDLLQALSDPDEIADRISLDPGTFNTKRRGIGVGL